MPIHHRSGLALPLLAALVLAGAARPQTPAQRRAEEARDFEALLATLVAPLDPALVGAAVRHARVRDAEAAHGLIVHLSVHRGPGALEGFVVLTGHGDQAVRVAALRAIATVGLRSTDALEAVRGRVRDFDTEVHKAAIAALGVVGQADDVPQLVELLAADEDATRAAAFRALRALTGVRIANDESAWTYWWGHARKELARRVDDGIARLVAGGDEFQLAEARRLLEQSAWSATRRFEETVREWLLGAEPRLRAEGFRLAAAARLAEVADDVLRALDDESEPAVQQVGRECAWALAILAPQQPDAAPPAGR